MAKFSQPKRSNPQGVYTTDSVSKYASAYKSHECGIHDLTYKSFRPGCPLCEATRTVDQLRESMQEMRNRLTLLESENQKLKGQADLIHAIRTAVDLLGDEDMEFLKATMYQWRDEKSLALKSTHGGTKRRGVQAAANGFIVMPRHGDPYGHSCTSVGGLAIAEYFDEAMNAGGPNYAMSTLARGLAPLLPGRS